MNDRPTACELVEAVRLFLEKELLPGLTDARLRFQTLVAANVLAIAGREMSTEETQLREELRVLASVLGESSVEPAGVVALRRTVREMNERLCGLIREGGFDEPERWRETARMQKELVRRKLEVANPRYAASTRVAENAGK